MEDKEYKTRDMYLATCLMVEGVKYLRKEKDEEDSRRLIFIFEQDSEIERIVQQRANGTHVVSSVSYEECSRRIKTIIHSQ